MDSVKVYALAGTGGNGSQSFRREKFVPKGGPDGGDGGKGGSVIFRGDRDEDSLLRVYFNPHQRAEHGGPGRGQQMHGKNGRDRVTAVPCGTEVWNEDTGERIGDIVGHGQELIVARGGKGGLGNCHFKSSTHQAPLEYTEGVKGEEVTLRLELKLMADIGLVGFPNAGKSSLLKAISDAHPKVAAYPFTTLNPIIGTLVFENYVRIRVADIPGLIKGAHEGVGLGYDFLRHIERAACLVYVLDMAGVDGRNAVDDFAALQEEVRLYREDLLARPSVIVANKMDLPESKEKLADFLKKTRKKAVPVSALAGEGLDRLKQALFKLYQKTQAKRQQA